MWIAIGALAGSGSDAGGVIFFLGYLASVTEVLVGTLIPRVTRRRRRPRT